MSELYDKNGKADHYNKTSIEVIVMMERVWGIDATISFCELTIFKYRMRLGDKDAPELEVRKIKWYENKIQELLKRKNVGKKELTAKQMWDNLNAGIKEYEESVLEMSDRELYNHVYNDDYDEDDFAFKELKKRDIQKLV